MRRSVIIVVVLVLSTIAFAQKVKATKVPEIVTKSLMTKYPNAKNIKWDKEENNYEASFENNKTENSVLFNLNGKIIETEVEISTAQLPKSILSYLSKNYKDQKVKEAAKIISKKGIVTYEAEINGKDLIFDENGKLLSVS